MLVLPPLYAIANVDDHQQPLVYLERLFAAGVQWIQIRAKSTPFERLEPLVNQALALAPAQTRLLINDSVELCLATGAHGVHLGQHDLSPTEARARLGSDAIIGLSTHSADDAEQAQRQPINYIGCGPIFRSSTKQGHAPELGVNKLREICESSLLPVVAIGGITCDNARTVFEAGASAVAVIAELAKAPNLAETVLDFTRAKGPLLSAHR